MEPKPSWLEDPSNALGIHLDFDALRVRLERMSDEELLAFGKQMHKLVYPLTYDGDGRACRRFRSSWTRRGPNGGGGIQMPETNDQLVQQARDRLHAQIEKCSQRAAQRIAARLKSVSKKPSVELLAELIAREFDELDGVLFESMPASQFSLLNSTK